MSYEYQNAIEITNTSSGITITTKAGVKQVATALPGERL